jgi:dihydropteroate synthase
MTVCALLEPILGLTEQIWFTSSSKGLSYEKPTWIVTITQWQEEWGELPKGMRLVHAEEEILCTGQLLYTEICNWVLDLDKAGHNEPREALSRSMKAHTQDLETLWWGENKKWQLDFSQPRVMGIVNVTQDSFSGDGITVEKAIAQGLEMAKQGADILDIGGESTRPGANKVSIDQELAQVVPVVSALADQLNIPISIDTSKAEVMAASLDAGAAIINDVTALRGLGKGSDAKKSLKLLAESDCPIILMHMQGKPATMQKAPSYSNVMVEVYNFLAQRIEFCLSNGIARERIIIDPGIGFGKTPEHNRTLMTQQRVLRGLGVPVLLGLSRKSIVGHLSGVSRPQHRDNSSNLLAALGYLAGANIFRVHDVKGACEALTVAKGWFNGMESTP